MSKYVYQFVHSFSNPAPEPYCLCGRSTPERLGTPMSVQTGSLRAPSGGARAPGAGPPVPARPRRCRLASAARKRGSSSSPPTSVGARSHLVMEQHRTTERRHREEHDEKHARTKNGRNEQTHTHTIMNNTQNGENKIRNTNK